MTIYIEYELTDNSTILIESKVAQDEVINTSPGIVELTKKKARKSFTEALKEVKVQAKLLIKEIEELHVSEAEVKFGINTVGELGNMAVGKVGAGVNYEVTLKWKKPEEKHG